MTKTQSTPELEAFLAEIKQQRKLADDSVKKYRQKLALFHQETCGTPFKNIDFLKDHVDLLIPLIQLQSKSAARSTYSAFYACCQSPDKWVRHGFERASKLFKAGMEELNQQYQERKKKQPHSDKQLKNWVKLEHLFKLQHRLYRNACKVKKQHAEGTALKWRDFKDIQDCLIVTMYLNHRKANEKYPAWYVLHDISMNLPDESQASLPAPKRLEWCYVEVRDFSDNLMNNMPDDKNLLVVNGEKHDRKRLWFAKQKNKREHFEPVHRMLNSALELQLWGKSQLKQQAVKTHSRLLINQKGQPLKPKNLADYIREAFSSVSECMTTNLLRHIVAEETGHDSNVKKQVEEQMVGMNHSEHTHNLVYST